MWRTRAKGNAKELAPPSTEVAPGLETQKPRAEQGNKSRVANLFHRPKSPVPRPVVESAKPSLPKKPNQSLVDWTKKFYATTPPPVTTRTEVVDAYDAMYNGLADKGEKYHLIAAMQQHLGLQLEALDYWSHKKSVSGEQRDEKQAEDKKRMERQHQDLRKVSREEQTTKADAVTRLKVEKRAVSPENREKDVLHKSVKSSTELQRDERHREHQDEHKAPKQGQASKAVTTTRSEAEGKAVSSVVSKEKELKPRDIDDKFDRSEMSGNIQNTAARDKLTREVQTYFKDTLWAMADGDDPSKLENLVKAFVKICEESAKKIAEVVDRFSVEFQKERDVADALTSIAQLDSQGDKKGLFQLVVAIHSPPFYMDREGKKLSTSEWQLFQKVIFLKSLTLRISQPRETIKGFVLELAEKELQPLLRPRRYSSAGKASQASDIHEKFINTSVCTLVDMLLSPNPIIPSITLDRFDSKYVTMDLWDFEEFKNAARVAKADGQPIAAFKRPILLTCTYQTVKAEPGYVRMDLTVFRKP